MTADDYPRHKSLEDLLADPMWELTPEQRDESEKREEERIAQQSDPNNLARLPLGTIVVDVDGMPWFKDDSGWLTVGEVESYAVPGDAPFDNVLVTEGYDREQLPYYYVY